MFVLSSITIAQDLEINREGMVIGGVRYPLVLKYKDSRAKNLFNAKVKSLASTLRCSYKKTKSVGAFWSVKSDLAFMKNDIISLKIRSSYNCDGLRFYNDVDSSFTFDMLNTRELKISDIISNKDKSLNFIRNKFRKDLNQSCINKISFYLDDPKLFSKWISFSLDDKGIHLRLEVPSPIRDCSRDIFISYDIASEKLSTTSLFKRIH